MVCILYLSQYKSLLNDSKIYEEYTMTHKMLVWILEFYSNIYKISINANLFQYLCTQRLVRVLYSTSCYMKLENTVFYVHSYVGTIIFVYWKLNEILSQKM